MTIGIANDHTGVDYNQKLTKYLETKGYNVINYGPESKESSDYPDYVFELCNAINNKEADYGIVICRTGIGVSIACNKVKGIRCAKVCNVKEAQLTRNDNDANVLAFSFSMPFFEIKDIVDIFLKTNFSEEERHSRRIKKITDYEERHYK